MSGTNDFLPYAVGSGANVLTQAQYAALTTLLQNGLTSGIVPSNELNKILRQPSIMAAVIGQLIADSTGQNVVDDGTTATILANLARAIRGDLSYAIDTGTANAIAIALSPAPTALTDGMVVRVKTKNANTGPVVINPNSLGNIHVFANGSELAGGEILANGFYSFEYDAAVNVFHKIGSSKGELAVSAGTSSGHAVNLGQLLSKVVGGGLAAYADVTSSRAIGTVYTNTSGHPIGVYVTIRTGATTGDGCRLLVGGLEISQFYTQVAASSFGNLSATVPEGATYEVASAVGTNTLSIWDEL